MEGSDLRYWATREEEGINDHHSMNVILFVILEINSHMNISLDLLLFNIDHIDYPFIDSVTYQIFAGMKIKIDKISTSCHLISSDYGYCEH